MLILFSAATILRNWYKYTRPERFHENILVKCILIKNHRFLKKSTFGRELARRRIKKTKKMLSTGNHRSVTTFQSSPVLRKFLPENAKTVTKCKNDQKVKNRKNDFKTTESLETFKNI